MEGAEIEAVESESVVRNYNNSKDSVEEERDFVVEFEADNTGQLVVSELAEHKRTDFVGE